MASYQLPDFSSSPAPSTPNKRSYNGHNPFSFGASNPSTTPAGPPPSSAGSFTPAGPPPSSVLGSSMFDTTPNPVRPINFHGSGTSTNLGRHHSRQDLFQSQAGYSEEEEEGEEEEEDEQQEEEDMEYEEDDQGESAGGFGYNYGEYESDADADGDDDMVDYDPEESSATRPNRDERNHSNHMLATPAVLRNSIGLGTLPIQLQSSVYGKLAKDESSRMGFPSIDESDGVVLNTEDLVSTLYDEVLNSQDEAMVAESLVNTSRELITLWSKHDHETALYDSEEYTATIGPASRASNFAKANFVAGLALQIYHPQPIGGAQTNLYFNAKPLPQVLIEWLDEHHDPLPSQFEEIQSHRPSPANHSLFWDTILNGLVRGKVAAVVKTLSSAGWKHARGESDNIREFNAVGYRGVALANVEKVILAAVKVLKTCPGANGDWDICGSDWTLFRLRASQALEELRTFAEGKNKDRVDSIGLDPSHGSDTYSITAKKAGSQVPWEIYQQLSTLYSLLIGDPNAIISNSQDWCEATVGLLVWWDDKGADRRLALSRSQSNQQSLRGTDAELYLRKIRRAFVVATTGESELQVDSSNSVELGLASLFEGDNEAVICMLRSWSGPVSSAVAEIASMAGWLPRSEPQSLISMGGSLDQEDLDLLGGGSLISKTDGVKDQTLIVYANSIAQRKELQYQGFTRKGWELAISVLGRLDSSSRSEDLVGEFLDTVTLDSTATVDRLWSLLNTIGMNRHAENVAEAYADFLAEGSHKYGEALWYYALAHKTQKVKDVLDLLNSYSLMQSTAYPPENELDGYLARLISSPKDALTELSKMDFAAAELLHDKLSGYATLRKFYSIRDEEVLLPRGKKLQRGTIARKEEAAAALLAVITSSDDNISGGLYDEERGAVVGVDFLLALLGEAMVFVNQPKLSLTVTQIGILLQTIEDLQSVGPRVYTACDEFLAAVIASGSGVKGSNPKDLLRKSTSNTSGTSSFSMVGSSMMASQLKQSMSGSGVLVKGNTRRGWDWRKGVTSETKGSDVLRILRHGLATDLANAWLVEVDSRVVRGDVLL